MLFKEVKIKTLYYIYKGGNILTNDQIYSMISRMRALNFEINTLRKSVERQNELLEKNIKVQEEMLKILKNK